MKLSLTVGFLVLFVSAKRVLQSTAPLQRPPAPSIDNPTIYNEN